MSIKAKDRKEFEAAWRSHFAGLASLTLQCDGTLACQLHEEMRVNFEAILLVAATQAFGDKEGTLIKEIE